MIAVNCMFILHLSFPESTLGSSQPPLLSSINRRAKLFLKHHFFSSHYLFSLSLPSMLKMNSLRGGDMNPRFSITIGISCSIVDQSYHVVLSYSLYLIFRVILRGTFIHPGLTLSYRIFDSFDPAMI